MTVRPSTRRRAPTRPGSRWISPEWQVVPAPLVPPIPAVAGRPSGPPAAPPHPPPAPSSRTRCPRGGGPRTGPRRRCARRRTTSPAAAPGRRHPLAVEPVDRERPPPLVDRHRVPGDLDVLDLGGERPPGLLDPCLPVQPPRPTSRCPRRRGNAPGAGWCRTRAGTPAAEVVAELAAAPARTPSPAPPVRSRRPSSHRASARRASGCRPRRAAAPPSAASRTAPAPCRRLARTRTGRSGRPAASSRSSQP